MTARLPSYNDNVFWQILSILLSTRNMNQKIARSASVCSTYIPPHCQHSSVWSDRVYKKRSLGAPSVTIGCCCRKKKIKNERLGVIHRRRMLANRLNKHTARGTCDRHRLTGFAVADATLGTRGGNGPRRDRPLHCVHLLQRQSWQHTTYAVRERRMWKTSWRPIGSGSGKELLLRWPWW